jgi:Fe2+ transport system protein B
MAFGHTKRPQVINKKNMFEKIKNQKLRMLLEKSPTMRSLNQEYIRELINHLNNLSEQGAFVAIALLEEELVMIEKKKERLFYNLDAIKSSFDNQVTKSDKQTLRFQ